MLELGCGTGRVSLHLAGNGHAVSAIEIDAVLATEAARRAAERRLDVHVSAGDALDAEEAGFGAALAPMQLVQAIPASERNGMLDAMRRSLREGGLAALAFVDDDSLEGLHAGDDQESAPLPDVRELDGWVFSSQPLWVSVDDEAITVTRVREAVAPDGQLFRGAHRDVLARLTAAGLEREAAGSALSPVERLVIPRGVEVDTTIVILEAR